MNWVYSTWTGRPEQVPVIKQTKYKANLLSSLLGLGRSSTPQRMASRLPPQLAIIEAECLKVGESSIVLAIFTAQVAVDLSQELLEELCRSVKSIPPRILKCELIYV